MNRFDHIKEIVAREIGVRRDLMDGKSKTGLLPWARHIAIWVASQFPETSNVREIMQVFHRSKNAITHAINVVNDARRTDAALHKDTERILHLCKPSNRLREIEFIKAVVATHLDVPITSFAARDRLSSRARHIAYWIASQTVRQTLTDLAAAFGFDKSGFCEALQQMDHNHSTFPIEAEIMDRLLRIVTAAFVAEGLCCEKCRQPLPKK